MTPSPKAVTPPPPPPPAAGGGGGGIGSAEYATAKTAALWDIESCHVPMGCDPNAVGRNIGGALEKMGFSGRLTISAYGDVRDVPSDVVQAISSTGIALHHVPAGVKGACDKKILIDMLLWAIDNPAPANVLLISGERDFSGALHQLRLRKYNILLAQPTAVSPYLAAAANHFWNWTDLVSGKHALSLKDNSAKSGYPVAKYLPSGGDHLNTDLRLENECKTPFPSHPLRTSSSKGKEAQGVRLDLTVEISGQRHLRCPPDTKKKTEVKDDRCNRVAQTLKKVKKKKGEECRNILKQKARGRLNNNNSTKTASSSEQQIVDEQMCSMCEGYHPGKQCYWATGACFVCGKLDHKIQMCPFINPEVKDNRCNRVAQTLKKVKKKKGKECRNILEQKARGRLNNNNSTKTASSSEQQIVDERMCSMCEGYHPGKPCYWATGACFVCGKLDHKIQMCPSINPDVLCHMKAFNRYISTGS